MPKWLNGFGVLAMILSLLVAVAPVAAAPTITIIAEAGVSDAARADTQASANTTMAYFLDNYGLELQKPLRHLVLARLFIVNVIC